MLKNDPETNAELLWKKIKFCRHPCKSTSSLTWCNVRHVYVCVHHFDSEKKKSIKKKKIEAMIKALRQVTFGFFIFVFIILIPKCKIFVPQT